MATAGKPDRTVTVGTDVAFFCPFHPDDLRHRKDAGNWTGEDNGSVHPPGWGEFLSALGTLIGDDRLGRRADSGPPKRARRTPPQSGISGSGGTESQG